MFVRARTNRITVYKFVNTYKCIVLKIVTNIQRETDALSDYLTVSVVLFFQSYNIERRAQNGARERERHF